MCVSFSLSKLRMLKLMVLLSVGLCHLFFFGNIMMDAVLVFSLMYL